MAPSAPVTIVTFAMSTRGPPLPAAPPAEGGSMYMQRLAAANRDGAPAGCTCTVVKANDPSAAGPAHDEQKWSTDITGATAVVVCDQDTSPPATVMRPIEPSGCGSSPLPHRFCVRTRYKRKALDKLAAVLLVWVVRS